MTAGVMKNRIFDPVRRVHDAHDVRLTMTSHLCAHVREVNHNG